MKMKSKYLFGWTNIKFVVTEIVKLYSSDASYFSKKRIESGAAFIIAQWGMIYFLIKKIEVMTSSDLGIWASMEFLVAGYTVSQIQKEKKQEPKIEE